MPNYTPNINLEKPLVTENYDVGVFNGNSDILDTQISSKAPLASPTFTGTVVLPSTTSIGNVTSTELGYVDGVTSSIQTQLNSKAPTASPTFTGIVSGITASMVGLGNVTNESKATMFTSPTFTGTAILPSTTSIGTVSSTEIGYLDGVTSSIQTQINGKQATITGGATTITSSNLTASRVLISDASGKVATNATTSTEIGYVSGVTSAIQTQLNNKSGVSTIVTTSLASASWTGSSAPYTYSLTVSGVTTTSVNEIYGTTTITSTELDAFQKANIIDGGQSTNTITLLAYGTKPTINIPIRVVVRKDL